jgi:hypothetical protein
MITPRINHTITACRLLLLLQQLIQQRRLTYAKINQIFQAHDSVGRPIGSETLTKYIATLRYWGCDIPKATIHNQFHYQLNSYPLPTGLTSPQKAVINLALEYLPQAEGYSISGKQAFQDQTDGLSVGTARKLLAWWVGLPTPPRPLFLPGVEKKLVDDTALLDEGMDSAISKMLPMESLQPLPLKTTWNDHWQTWWLGGTWVQVTLHHTLQPLTIEPEGIQTTPHGSIVTGWEVTSGRWTSIPLSTIVRMHPLPMRSRGRGQRMTLTFAISGRLAQNYRLYPHETDVTPEGSLPQQRIVQARVNDTDALLTRLMKYGRLCEVISPEWARDAMQKRIQRLCMAAGLAH